jgi:1-acyl-sn-glycerol-3-phosphate acyltransferase
VYKFLKTIACLLVFITMRPTVKGSNNIPAKGPFILVSNHLSVADPILLGVKIKQKIHFMGKEELFRNKFIAYFIKGIGSIPVYRGSANREALHRSSVLLKSGKILGMFPEGKRSLTGSLTQGQQGAALIAYHNKIQIVPVSVIGTEQIRGKAWLFHRPRVIITIGEPFYLPEIGHTLRREQIEGLTTIIMKKIAFLLPEKYKGQYSDENKNN